MDAGGIVVEVLGSSAFASATRADLEGWIVTFGLTVTSLIDAPGLNLQTINQLQIREATVIVQIPSMQVIWYDRGDQSGMATVRTAADKAIDEMLRLLAP